MRTEQQESPPELRFCRSGSAIFSDTDDLAVSVILSVPNAERSLVPHRGDGSVDWKAIAFDPELAKRCAKINGINAEG